MVTDRSNILSDVSGSMGIRCSVRGAHAGAVAGCEVPARTHPCSALHGAGEPRQHLASSDS